MKKGTAILLKILSVLIIIGAIECLVAALLYNGSADKIENISEIDVSAVNDSTKIYFEEIEILERYAFETVYEYNDSENSYSDTTYYVYDDSQPMDKNELFTEYYIVKFCDNSGKEYITSLSVLAKKKVASSLKNTPLKIYK